MAQQKADAWIILSFSDKRLPPADNAITKRLRRMAEGWMKTSGFSGKHGEITSFPSWENLPAKVVVLLGLGSRIDLTPGRAQRAAATAARLAKRLSLREIAVSLAPLSSLPSIPVENAVNALVQGFDSGRYDFVEFLSAKGRRHGKSDLRLLLTDAKQPTALQKVVAEALLIGEVMTDVRDLANQPANEATPAAIVRTARVLAAKYGVRFAAARRGELARTGCNALLAVAQGSSQEPFLLTLTHRGRNPKLKPIVLVGKTVTFDTGGISLKPGRGMEWMRYDKCGGMAVLAATLIASRLKLRHPVIGILPIVENMPGGRATRPGDIVRSHSGKTIEIINTDAEGRLILADALSVAKDLKPEAIVDLATLTGACIVALGHVLSAVMGNNEKLVEQLRKAGEASGDRLWPFPLLPEYADAIRTPFADIKNVSADGAAGTIIGGIFLRSFVPENIPWAHVDIAGTAWEEKEPSYTASGATLFGTRLLIEWITDLEKTDR